LEPVVTSDHDDQWSKELKAMTREAIANPPVGDELAFKHDKSGFATISAEDLLTGDLVLCDHATGNITVFETVDELIAAGWAVD
jgi:hypothetical protein